MQSWLEVDLAAVTGNARTLAARVAPAKLCAVVKSNAYGHGLVPVSRALSAAGIQALGFAVFRVDEGLALREAGFEEPVLVVGPVEGTDVAEAAAGRLELGLLREQDAPAFARHAIRAHLKVETGTQRFGLDAVSARRTLEQAQRSGLAVVGVYSHLANAEDLDKEFTLIQVERLKNVVANAAVNGRDYMCHLASSAAAMMWPQTRLDMVRCGVALYGAWPSSLVRKFMAQDAPDFRLRPALRWLAPIVEIKQIAAGEPVGYGCAFVPERASKIAVLPVGYADGFPRMAGNERFAVRFRSATAPIVGRICMNACMADVTDVAGELARIGPAEIDVEELAAAAGTINYEILARLSPALERRYSG